MTTLLCQQGIIVSEKEANTRGLDARVVERVLGGDSNAFKELFDRHYQRVRNVALGVVGNPDDAEEVTQEAFLKAYRNLASFRGQSSFYTWLYRIVFNLAIDYGRKKYRQTEVSVGEVGVFDVGMQEDAMAQHIPLSKSVTPDQVLEQTELGLAISNAIAALSPEHRAVIILREVEGLSYTEMSDVLNCSKGTVMSRLHHARKRLQKTLAQFRGADQSKLESSRGR